MRGNFTFDGIHQEIGCHVELVEIIFEFQDQSLKCRSASNSYDRASSNSELEGVTGSSFGTTCVGTEDNSVVTSGWRSGWRDGTHGKDGKGSRPKDISSRI